MTVSAPLAGKPTFGAGRVFATGNYANPTPARALVPQSQSIDIKRKTESLYGEGQLPVAIGAGEMDITGKVEYGEVNARIFADIIFGDSGTTGSYLEADGETGTVAAASPFIVTVANATNFLFDLGVVNATTGAIYSCVPVGTEVAGASYSLVSSGSGKGKYTFAAGDEGANMQISYAYANATTGETIVMTNQLQGLTGNFTAVHVLPWGAQQDMFVFTSCIATSGGISLKKSGFASHMLEYTANLDNYGKLGTATFAQAA